MSTKIQINSLEALERLIGGDTELEIEVRRSVVQAFAEKHLKAVANDPKIHETFEGLKKDVLKQVDLACAQGLAEFQRYYGSEALTNVVLRPAIAQKIDERVKKHVDDILRDKVTESLELWTNEDSLDRLIEAKFKYYTDEIVRKKVNAKLDNIKQSLGL